MNSSTARRTGPGRSGLRVGVAIAMSVVMTGCGLGSAGSETQDAESVDSIDALIEAAQEDGEITVYGSPSDSALTAAVESFGEKYDIGVNVVRIAGNDLNSRFATEKQADAPTADVLLSNLSTFNRQAIEEGWIMPLEDADIPGYPWELDDQWLRPDDGTAVVGLQIRGIAYNTELVSPAEVPQTWSDVIDPRWRGRIGIADPASAPVYIGHWWTVAEDLGGDYLEQVGALNPKVYASGTPTTAALGAGEIAMFPMNISSITQEVAESGGPVDIVIPETTTADEQTLALNAETTNPNAARLFVYYMMSEEGSGVLASAGGEASPFDTENLPDELLTWPVDLADERRDDVVAALTR